MEINQIYQVVNSITTEILGDSAVVNEDLTNIVDIGNSIQSVGALDKYVKSLPDHIGKVVFNNRLYSGNCQSVMMDGWEYGSILEKVTYDGLPEATENESWSLNDGQTYDVNVFTQPTVSAKFFNKRTTFEIPMSFADKQVKSAFDSVSQLNSFYSMIYNNIDNSMTVKNEGLVSRVINSSIAGSINAGGLKAINLLATYKEAFPLDTNITVNNCLFNPEFIRHASFIIKLFSQRLTKMSKLFNIGGKERFTSNEKQHIALLSEFDSAASVYLQSETFHKELVALPKAETVPYWQGSGSNYLFSSTSAINVTIPNPSGGSALNVNKSGILGFIWDRNALGVCNIDRRVTSNYNGKGEFFNNWYKADAGYFNDFNENAIVFFVEDVE